MKLSWVKFSTFYRMSSILVKNSEQSMYNVFAKVIKYTHTHTHRENIPMKHATNSLLD